MKKQELFLNTMPDSNCIWKEIGGNYENAEQSINELVDNSISNIIGHDTAKKKIQITIEEATDLTQSVYLNIEDSGIGIQDAEQAFTLGSIGSDSILNEHGFGMKQALSGANPENNDWHIYKRSKENIEKSEIMYIHAPYIIGKQPYELLPDSKWPGHKWGNTFVRVRCDSRLLENLSPSEISVKNIISFDFDTICDRIYEDLGMTYSILLENKEIEMIFVIKHANGTKEEHVVTPLKPMWLQKFPITNEKYHLVCNFGQIEKLPARVPFNNRTSNRYYKTNIFSSGVEIRINGRLMEYNKFEEIFGKKNDHHYNSLLVQVDIQSEDRLELPETKTTKNGFRVGDKRLTEIYAWIRKSIKPDRKSTVKPVDVSEQEQKKKLAELIEEEFYSNQELTLQGNDKITTREVPVFKTLLGSNQPKVDVLVTKNDIVSVIEAKKDAATVKDLYQLMMYCDGYYLDNDKMPDEAILVANSFSEGLRRIIEYHNKRNGSSYPKFQWKYWNEYQENFKENLIEEKKLKMKY